MKTSLAGSHTGTWLARTWRYLLDQAGLGAWMSGRRQDGMIQLCREEEPRSLAGAGPGLWCYDSSAAGELELRDCHLSGRTAPCPCPCYLGELPGEPVDVATVDGRCLFGRDGQRIYCRADLPRFFHEALSRREELDAEVDEHGRFAPEHSALRPYLELPVLDLWGEALRSAARGAGWALPSVEVGSRPGGVLAALTHDVDSVNRAPKPSARLINRWPRRLLDRLNIGAGAGARALRAYASLEQDHGWSGCYYFLGQRSGTVHRGYEVSDGRLRREIARLIDRGHEIGLHGSYDAMESPEQLRKEAYRARQLAGQELTGCRMHYLRIRMPQTLRNLAAEGFQYDSTLGYTPVAGFRAGTSMPFQAVDGETGQPLDIWEMPFSMMDCTFLSSMGLSLEEACEAIESKLGILGGIGGCAVLLFHPCRLTTHGDVYYRLYERSLDLLDAHGARVHTGGELCRFFRARQAARGEVLDSKPDETQLRIVFEQGAAGLHLLAPPGWRLERTSAGSIESAGGFLAPPASQGRLSLQITMHRGS